MWGWCFWAVMATSLWLPTSLEYRCLDHERTNLLDFKAGLLDPSERMSSWKGYNCCQWEGVVCDNVTGHVIELHLGGPPPQKQTYSRSLSGNIRGSLFQLKQLGFLDLSYNSFDGLPIPSQLGSLRKLAYLNLSNAGFSGQIPKEIGNMPALRHLDLSSSYYASPFSLKLEKPNLGTWLRNLTGLTYLSLDGVNISSAASEQWGAAVGSLSNLEHLHMSYCGLSGRIPSSLGNLTSLSHLHLGGNSFSSIPPWLGNLSSLRSIQLSDCKLSGSVPSGLFRFGLLQHVFLSNNPLLKGSLVFILQAHSSLNRLVLSGTDVGGQIPSSLGNITSLTVLDLSNTAIGGRIPPSIANLSELVKLDLSRSRLSGQIPPVGGLISLTHLDLSGTQLEGSVPPSLGELQALSYVDLSANQLSGSIPSSFCNLSSLITLDLSRNLLSGGIPSFSNDPPSRLRTLNLSENSLNSTFPNSISSLSELRVLSLSYNGLVGTVSISLLDNLTALVSLDLSENRLTVNIDPIWIPPFRLNFLKLRSCRILGGFPAFLMTQSDIYHLDLSNNNLTEDIPTWLWDQLPNLQHLNLSHNKLQGQLPPFLSSDTLLILDLHRNRLQGDLPLPPRSVSVLDLSENQFSGSIPQNIGQHIFSAMFVSFSGNNLSNGIPYSICDGYYLQVLDLSKNKLSGSIPASFANCSTLGVLNLAKNELEGEIPGEVENAKNLRTLNLNGNRLKGSIPPSLAHCKALEILDLGNNEIQGSFPEWIQSLHGLRILVLRSNRFRGNIRLEAAASLTDLQILDLSNNNFSGIIPENIIKLSAMSNSSERGRILNFTVLHDLLYVDHIIVASKGRDLEFVKILTIVTCIDLSGNDFSGDIPEGMGSLKGLIILNISRNRISGQIPNSLGDMVQLESLDLSRNMLQGSIPQGLIRLTFLSFLNLSYNILSGRIPIGNQFATFDSSSYLGNAHLCGSPLSTNCSGSELLGKDTFSPPSLHIGVPSNTSINWFRVIMGMSFGMGAGAVTAPLLFVRKWRKKYFELVDGVAACMLDLSKCPEVCRDTVEETKGESESDREPDGVRRFCIRCTHIDRVTENVIHTECNCP